MGKSATVEPSVPPKQESCVTLGVQNHTEEGWPFRQQKE